MLWCKIETFNYTIMTEANERPGATYLGIKMNFKIIKSEAPQIFFVGIILEPIKINRDHIP